MRAGIDESLGHVRHALCISVPPLASMDEDVYRRVGLLGDVDVELFDVSRTVGDSTRWPEARQRSGALLRIAFCDFSCVGGPGGLIVGKDDLLLVIVEKDDRTLRLCRHARR